MCKSDRVAGDGSVVSLERIGFHKIQPAVAPWLQALTRGSVSFTSVAKSTSAYLDDVKLC